MPVRIVLRGLIGMIVTQDKDNPEQGTITAVLIDGSRTLDHAVHSSLEKHKDGPEPHPHFEECMLMHKTHHKHQGEMQVFDGDKTRDAAGLVALRPGENIDIRIYPEKNKDVRTDPSYDKFMPKIARIAANVGLEGSGKLNPAFFSNTVTINRGVVRVRDVGDWDAGSLAIPEKFRRNDDSVPPRFRPGGADPVYQPDGVYQAAKVRFLNTGVVGYVATECVVDVEDATSVTIGEGCQFAGTYRGHSEAGRRAAEDTVEILITNYAPQQLVPLPWTLHYRWMFEAAGFNQPIRMGGPELDDLAAFGNLYNDEAWVCESEMFLEGKDYIGYPFPYRTPDLWLSQLGPLEYPRIVRQTPTIPVATHDLQHSDPWDPIACPMGDLTPGK